MITFKTRARVVCALHKGKGMLFLKIKHSINGIISNDPLECIVQCLGLPLQKGQCLVHIGILVYFWGPDSIGQSIGEYIQLSLFFKCVAIVKF